MRLLPTLNRVKFEQRFFSKIEKKSKCWEWKAGRNVHGYGIFGLNGKSYLAHRISYAIKHDLSIINLNVLHTCDNRGCVNPKHLYLGTQKDNFNDMVNRGRRILAKGEKQHSSKLTKKEVLEIRKSYIENLRNHPFSIKNLSIKYGVRPSSIHKIIKRVTWKHI